MKKNIKLKSQNSNIKSQIIWRLAFFGSCDLHFGAFFGSYHLMFGSFPLVLVICFLVFFYRYNHTRISDNNCSILTGLET